MTKYITYLRVSTQQQGNSGLGLEAQRASVNHFASNNEIIAEYVEVESGKRAMRPQLLAALAHVKKAKATLLIAKLDRLSRNVHFITGLLEAKVDFVAVDMPHANKFNVQIMAVMAEWERDQISARTKAALAVVKARGIKLGGPVKKATAAAVEVARSANTKARELAVRLYDEEGMTYAEIALELQRAGILTRNNHVVWHPTQVRRLVK